MNVAAKSTPLAVRDPELEGLRVLIVGLGRSGLAAARIVATKGAIITIADDQIGRAHV